MDTKDLEVLLALHDCGSFPRAAAALGIPLPTLRSRVRLLQQQAGVKVVHRSGRGIALTEAGRAAIPAARRALDLMRAAGETIARQSQPVLAIGTVDLVGTWLLGTALAEALTERPDLALTVYTDSSERVRAMLHDGLVRLGLLVGPPVQGREEGCVWQARAPLDVLAAPAVSDEDGALRRLPYALPREHWWLKNRLSATVWPVGSVAVVKALAEQGRALAVLGLGAADAEVQAGRLRRIQGTELSGVSTMVTALIHPGTRLTGEEQAFVCRLAGVALAWLQPSTV